MSPLRLAIRSLFYYLKRNVLLALGIAISTAVLTGSLIVGDSVSYSLQRIVDQRLGKVTHVMQSDDRYFTLDLTTEIRSQKITAAPVLLSDGIAVSGGGKLRVNDIQVLGVDSGFDEFAGQDSMFGSLHDDRVIINHNLAERLNIAPGDEFLLRIKKESLVPMNAPFVSDASNTISLRVKADRVAGINQLGNFNLKKSQTAPLNVYISREYLSEAMDLGNRANLLLFDTDNTSADELSALVKKSWHLEDIGLQVQASAKDDILEVKSDRIFIGENIADAVMDSQYDVSPILTYFVNFLSHGMHHTPYSFVSTLSDSVLGPNDMVINQWLSDDLDAMAGDSITITYYEVGPLRELETRQKTLMVNRVVPIEGYFADRSLMPEIPGLSDAGNCRDWETGVPIRLDSIRDKDEDYWTRYKGTPKAFIAETTAEELWQNRFGKYTSFRVHAGSDDVAMFSQDLIEKLTPEAVGYQFKAVRSEGNFAARNGVDFSELFAGLSFFLLAGAILLIILLFRLNLLERKEQVATLVSSGISRTIIRRVFLAEGMIVAALGALVGVALAIFYNKAIFHALNSIWMDIVRTEMLVTNIQPLTLLTGFLSSVVIALIAVYFPLNNFLKSQVRKHSSTRGKKIAIDKNPGRYIIVSVLIFLAAIALIVLQFTRGDGVDAGIFFISGGLLLLGGMMLSFGLLGSMRAKGVFVRNITNLGLKNTLRNTTRSMTIILLFSLGTFIVISTGSNRKDLFVNAGERTSGTGGFLYYAESTVPVLKNLNKEETKFEFGLGGNYDIVQMRLAEGDDASCLNLNRITNPRILGVDPLQLDGRFTFITKTDILDPENPWMTLNKGIPGDVIPAVADETVIKWGLGLKVGDTLKYQDAEGNLMKLMLVGGLAPSIFQGNVLISEDYFLERYPESSGNNVFLVDGAQSDTATIARELGASMRDYGWDMQYAPARLTEFNSITNTYLSIFLVMGALGLLLGTIGLSIVLFRSVVERRVELTTLRALGFGLKRIKGLMIREYLLLLFTGTLIGALAAVIATLPSLLNQANDVSLSFVISIVGVLLVNGFFWIWIMTHLAVKNKVISTALRNE